MTDPEADNYEGAMSALYCGDKGAAKVHALLAIADAIRGDKAPAPDPELIANNTAAVEREVRRGLRRDDEDDPELYADLMEARERAEWAMGERDRIRQERDEALMERAAMTRHATALEGQRDDALADRDAWKAAAAPNARLVTHGVDADGNALVTVRCDDLELFIYGITYDATDAAAHQRVVRALADRRDRA